MELKARSMTRLCTSFSTMALIASATLGLSSRAEEAASKAEINGKIWTQFTYDMTKNAGHKHGFDVYRAYLQANYKFDEEWSTRLLLDGVRENAKTDLAYVRNAYVEGTNLWSGKGTMRFGIQPTLYIPTIEGAFKTRWLGKTLADEAGLTNSQSGGVSVTGMGGDMVKYGLMIHNGSEGVSLPGASDAATATQVYVGVNPVEGLWLHVMDEIHGGTTGVGYNLMTAALTYNHPLVDGGFEYVMRKDLHVTPSTSGYGVTANFKFMDEMASLYVRFFAGNAAFQTKLKGKTAITVGPTYSVVKGKVSTAILYQTKAAITGNTATQSLMWNWAANF